MDQYNFARTYQFRVQLTRDGHRRLDDRLTAHCRLYNAALQERSDAWKMARRSITCAGQNRELTLVLQDDPDWAAEHRRLAVGTLKRVDDAFQAFFRRVKAGERRQGFRASSRARVSAPLSSTPESTASSRPTPREPKPRSASRVCQRCVSGSTGRCPRVSPW